MDGLFARYGQINLCLFHPSHYQMLQQKHMSQTHFKANLSASKG